MLSLRVKTRSQNLQEYAVGLRVGGGGTGRSKGVTVSEGIAGLGICVEGSS